MKYHGFVFLAAMAAVSCAAFAQDRHDTAPRAITIHGTVQDVDYANGTIRLHDSHGRERTIITSPSTTFIGAKSSGYEELSDIRSGARLTVEASKTEAELNAVLIKVQNGR